MSSIIQNLLIVVGLLIVLALGVYLWAEQSGQSLSLSFSSQAPTKITVQSQQFLEQFRELEAVTLDTAAVFDSTHFKSLTNFSRPVTPQPVGRTNPFAPVGE